MASRGEGVCGGVRFMSTWRWLAVVLCWLGMAGQVRAQTCTTVRDYYITCEQSGNIKVSLSCPDKYIIKVLTLSYRVASTPACPAAYSGDPPSDHCLVSDDPAGIRSECHNRQVCEKDVARDTSGTCGGNGAHYIRMVHYCEPLLHLNPDTSGVTSMESMSTLSGVHLVYISSNPLGTNGVTFTDTSLGCIITLRDDAQVIFTAAQFAKSPPQDGCDQKIQIWDGVSYVRSICSESGTEMTLGGCDVSGNTFYMKYLNSDPDVKVSFFMSVAVSHRAAGFDMLCGLQVASLPQVVVATPTPTPTPTTTQTPAPGVTGVNVATAPPQDEQSLKLIIILVSVAVSLIIIVIIIGVIIKKCSRKSTIVEGSEPEDLTDAKPVFNYLRQVYLHGDSSSKLVMDRRKSSTPSSGSMGLRLA